MRDRRWIPAAALLSVGLLVGLSPQGALQAQDQDRERVRLHARIKVLEKRVGQLERLIREQAVALEELRLQLEQRGERIAKASRAPAKTEEPAPAKTKEPAPAKAKVPAPAKAKVPAPAKESAKPQPKPPSVRVGELLKEAREKLAPIYADQYLERVQQLARDALKIDPASAEAYELLGRVALRKRRYQRALHELSKAISLAASPERYLLRAEVLLGLRDFDRALEDLDALRRAGASAPAEVWHLRARILLRQGRFEEAERSAQRFLERADAKDPARAEVSRMAATIQLRLAQRCYHRRDLTGAERALAACAKQEERVQQSAVFWLLSGQIQRARGHRLKALAEFERAVKLEPSEAAGYFYRGMQRFELGQAETGIADLERSLALGAGKAGDESVRVHLVLGQCYSAQGDWSRALSACEDFLRLAPKSHPEREEAEQVLAKAREELRQSRRNGPFRLRFDRGQVLRREGGSEGTELAVDEALAWLARAQSKDGRWDCDGWQGLSSHPKEGYNAGVARYDVGVTSLALLAFAGRGNTHQEGSYRKTCAAALHWLVAQQKEDGTIGFDQGEAIYNHAVATAALCELYGLSSDAKLREPAQHALSFCLRAQNPRLGWKYGVRPGRNDTSVTAWMTLALDAAQRAGLSVPEEAFAGAQRWFQRVTDTRGDVGYMTPGGGSSFIASQDGKFDPLPVMTGSALLGQVLAGEEQKALSAGGQILLGARPRWRPRLMNYYHWHFGTYATFQLGGKTWQSWNKAIQTALLPNQATTGPAKGSWAPVGEWCFSGGRVYATAINALTLQVYYRMARR